MTENIIKFGKAKKAIQRQKKDVQAAENRVKFGRTKAEKQQDSLQKTHAKIKLDGHKLTPKSES